MLNSKTNIWSWLSISIISIVILFFGLFDLRSHLITFITNQDKYLHVFTFFFLVFVIKALFKQLKAIKIAILVLIFSLLLEILQELFTHGLRHFHISDILANVLGIGLAALIIYFTERRKKSNATTTEDA